MPSNNYLLPYVYKVTNNKTGEFYIGWRFANVKRGILPENDILNIYFTSKETLKEAILENPEDFSAEILFRSGESIILNDKTVYIAFIYEQISIKENIKNPLCMNGYYTKVLDTDATGVFCRAGVVTKQETKDKISARKSELSTYNNGIEERQFADDPGGEWVHGRLPANILPGEQNGMYGRNHKQESKDSMSTTKKRMIEDGELVTCFMIDNPGKKLKGRKYDDIYGKERSLEIRNKRSNSLKGRPGLSGDRNPSKRPENAKKISEGRRHPITVDGVIYSCKQDACDKLGISLYLLNKKLATV